MDSDGEAPQITTKAIGVCQIVKAGQVFREIGSSAFDEAKTQDPEAGIEEFDGAGGVTDNSIENSSSPDETCVGMQLSERSFCGVPATPGSYECPRSITSGEHCMQRLVVDKEGEVSNSNGDNWMSHCLLTRIADIEE